MSSYKWKLCYVEDFENWSQGPFQLYFTPLPIDKQWGDDWDDAPYEHNAGTPYTEDYSQPEQGVENGHGIYPKIDIKKIYIESGWEVDMFTPRNGHNNSPYSVRDINFGVIPWVTLKSKGKDPIFLRAGMEMSKVIKMCQDFGVEVYTRKERRNGQTKSN